MSNNIDREVVNNFGLEWNKFNYKNIDSRRQGRGTE